MGVFITKKGISAKTNTDPSQWLFNSNYDTFKYLETLEVSVSVTDYAGLGTGATKTATVAVPPQFDFAPYYYSFFTATYSSNTYTAYDFFNNSISTSYVTLNSAGNTFTLYLNYENSGSVTYSITANIVIFGNAI